MLTLFLSKNLKVKFVDHDVDDEISITTTHWGSLYIEMPVGKRLLNVSVDSVYRVSGNSPETRRQQFLM